MSKTYTRDEVAKHNTKSDGWIIINNDVYDVSKFYDDHPGGRDVLLARIGTDATEDFEAIGHSSGAMKKVQELHIGSLVESERRKYMSMKEVAEKKTAEAAWFVINNKVYDVTKFLDNHPGGRDIILYNAGQDATEAFTNNGHSDAAYEMLKKFFIGDLEPEERRKIMSRKTTGAAHHADAGAPNSSKRGDESLLERLQEQLMLIIMIAVFFLAGAILLR